MNKPEARGCQSSRGTHFRTVKLLEQSSKRSSATIQGVRTLLTRCVDMRDKEQACLNAEVRDGEQLFAQPPKKVGTETSTR